MLASEVVKVWPEVIFPELRTPTLPSERSTPSTLNELTLNDDAPPPAPPKPPEVDDGIVPESRVSERISPPAAAETCRR